MDYVGRIYRPPSEARSLLVQVTIGCSHNRCTYCDMYRDKRFKPKDLAQVEKDLQEAYAYGPRNKRAFLCDGDALILPTKRLLAILELIRKYTPWIERVGRLRRHPLGRPQVGRGATCSSKRPGWASSITAWRAVTPRCSKTIEKGGTREEMVETARTLARGGHHSLGDGAPRCGRQEVQRAARQATRPASSPQMDPPYVGALTTTVVPGTPMAEAQANAANSSCPASSA